MCDKNTETTNNKIENKESIENKENITDKKMDVKHNVNITKTKPQNITETKPQNKRRYKNIDEVYGIIYYINCLDTNKYYIGQTLSHQYSRKDKIWRSSGIKSRFICHKREMKNGNNHNLYFDMRKYGIDNFEIGEVKRYYGKDILKLDEMEQIYIDEYNEYYGVYNIFESRGYTGLSRKLINEYYKVIDMNIKKFIIRENIKDNSSIYNLYGYSENLNNYSITNNPEIYNTKFERLSDAVTFCYLFPDIELDVVLIINKPKENITEQKRNTKNGNQIDKSKYWKQFKFDEKLRKLDGRKIYRIYSIRTNNKNWNKTKEFYCYVVFIVTDKTPIKFSFGGVTIDPDIGYDVSLEFTKTIKEKFCIENDIEEMIKNGCKNFELNISVKSTKKYDYEYQQKLDKFIGLKIDKIYVRKNYRQQGDFYTYTLGAKVGVDTFSITFGGRNITEEGAFKNLIIFTEKLLNAKNIEYNIESLIEKKQFELRIEDDNITSEKEITSEHKLERRIEMVKDLDIFDMYVRERKELLILSIKYTENEFNKCKRLSFGGETVDKDISYKELMKFVDKLCEVKNLDKSDYNLEL